MGIQINGQTDIISAVDGSLTVSGADFTSISAGTTSIPSISPTGDSNTGIFFPSADTIAFAEGGVEGLRLDSNGNVTIGTNSPVNLGGGGVLSKGIQIKNFTISNYDGEPNTYLTANGYYDNINWRYIQSKAAARYDLVSDHTWYTASSGTAGNTITWTERAKIDSSGNFQFNSGYGSAATAYGCRAWVNFDGTSGSIRGSGNVSSITKHGTGDYTVNFSSSMPDGNHSTVFMGSGAVNSLHCSAYLWYIRENYSSTSVSVGFFNDSNSGNRADQQYVTMITLR